ncbi:transcriptional regulator [Saccharomonospora piscinae]|uniref:Transcriptional regulator n=1 Tax=Saccharomonospora piscinae TaxID=687388 RepID=A0A1V8ZZP5_SACPI|nr:helix-turn-helix transcriptional regulator [Saccharomonospora piscinae]OQO90134.1 transcriptional regulator [Saccharomonospora piscinae]
MASNSDTPRARALGAEIRQARERSGLKQDELGARINRGKSHVSRWENGKLIPSEADTAQVLQALGVQGDERSRLLDLARDALDPDWLAPGVDRQLAALAEYERTAGSIVTVEPMLVPGLMQTYDYARYLVAESGASRGDAEQRAQLRVGRQHVLTRPKPPKVTAFIGEAAIRHAVCPDEVMADQLRHLLKLAELDNVTLHLVPADRPTLSVLSGPWSLLEFERTKPIVYLEHYGMSATITDSKSVALYGSAVDTLREVAMSPAETTGLIADVIENKETTR